MDYSVAFVCLMGMGTVFFGLICIVALCYLMSAVCRGTERKKPAPQPPLSRSGAATGASWWPPSPPPWRRSWAPTSAASASCP